MFERTLGIFDRISEALQGIGCGRFDSVNGEFSAPDAGECPQQFVNFCGPFLCVLFQSGASEEVADRACRAYFRQCFNPERTMFEPTSFKQHGLSFDRDYGVSARNMEREDRMTAGS